MDSEGIAALIAAVGVVIASAIRLISRDNARSNIERDLEIAKALPAYSAARISLQASIESRVTQLAGDVEATRNWFGVSLALMILSVFAWIAWITGNAGGGWWLVAVPAGLVTVIMIGLTARDFRKVPRDGQGRPTTPGPGRAKSTPHARRAAERDTA